MTTIDLGRAQVDATLLTALTAEGVPDGPARELARMDAFGGLPAPAWCAGLRANATGSNGLDHGALPEPWHTGDLDTSNYRDELRRALDEALAAVRERAAHREEILLSALRYAARGWAVFPCRAGDKVPATAHGFKDASTDPQQIRTWWTAEPDNNIGLACGASGLVVIDIDCKNGAPGWDTWKTLTAAHGPEVALTLAARTPSGGMHLYYAAAGHDVKSAANALGAGLDTRARGGYVVAPPSRIGDLAYTWLDEEATLTPFPAEFAVLLSRPSTTQIAGNGTQVHMDAGAHWLERAVARAAQGTRNETGFWLAAQLRDAGIAQADAWQVMADYAARVSLPGNPYTVEEARKSLTSAYSSPAREPAKAAPSAALVSCVQVSADVVNYTELNDAGNAELLAAMFAQSLRFDHRRGKWLTWDDTRWRVTDTETEKQRVLSVAEARKRGAALCGDDDRKKAIFKYARLMGNASLVANCLSLARSFPALALAGWELNRHEMLLPCANGTIELESGALRPSRPDELMTQSAGIAYDPEATCPRWEQFLQEVFAGNAEVIRFVHKAIGYSLTGSNKEQILFLCHGEGANGKSTMLTVLRALLGEFAANAPFSTFEQKRAGDTATNDLAALSLARLVTSSETSEAQRLNEARIKAVTGDTVVTCRFLYQEPFDYRPQFKVWLAMNALPRVTGTDNGIWRRIRLIPFNVSFEANPDKDLDKKLLAELPGILAWAVRGCLAWQQEGLNPPSEVIKATAQYRTENDMLGRFLDDCTIANPTAAVLASKLYNAYVAWCKENGERAESLMGFGLQMTRRNMMKQRTMYGWRYVGLSLYGVDDGDTDERTPKMGI